MGKSGAISASVPPAMGSLIKKRRKRMRKKKHKKMLKAPAGSDAPPASRPAGAARHGAGAARYSAHSRFLAGLWRPPWRLSR